MFPGLVTISLTGALFAMLRFSRYCKRLNRGQSMEDRELERCQAGLKRSLTALAFFLLLALCSMLLGLFIHG